MCIQMTKRLQNTAISLLILFWILVFSAAAFADTKAGTVMQLNGPLFAKKADGTVKVLAVNSVVELGDTLVTKKNTFTKIQFTDDGVMILRPNSQFKVSDYRFEEASPAKSKAVFNLVQGGVRAITGKIGKLGNTDGFQLMTTTATVGIRGTTFEARVCEGDCGSVKDGVYFHVLDGVIWVRNSAGLQDIRAGQYAYVESAGALPRLLLENPGIDFTLPGFLNQPPAGWVVGPRITECLVR